MSHRFGEASYALMNDFYQADRALREFSDSSLRDQLPEPERLATYSMLLGRMIDARDVVDMHPPWVLTPDDMVDGATCRIVAAILRTIKETADCPVSGDALRRISDKAADFIATEFRRVLLDRDAADEHISSARETSRAASDEARQDRVRMIFRSAVYQATLGAARAKLGELNDAPRGVDYVGELGRWQHFGVDVICRYEREKRMRGWLGWYYRWRGGDS